MHKDYGPTCVCTNANRSAVNQNIGAQFHLRVTLGLLNSSMSDPVGLARFGEVPNQERRPKDRQNRSNAHRRYLLFGGLSSPYPGIQILGIMLIGLCLTLLSVRGITWALDDLDRKRRIYGWLLYGVGALGALVFYDWAWSGHPLRVWGLGP